MQDSDREASEALLALGSTNRSTVQSVDLSPQPICIDIDKENQQRQLPDEWDHVHILQNDRKDPRVQCKYCNHVFTGGVTRIRAHLAKQLKAGVRICDKVKPQVCMHYQARLKEATEKSSKNLELKEQRLVLASATAAPVATCNGSIPAMFAKKNTEQVDAAVARFFYGNAIAFNVAESCTFRAMVEAISSYGSGYRPPAPTQLRTTLLDKAKEEVDDKLQVGACCTEQ